MKDRETLIAGLVLATILVGTVLVAILLPLPASEPEPTAECDCSEPWRDGYGDGYAHGMTRAMAVCAINPPLPEGK